jgi:uncharacterized protein (TIGR03435 family)
MRKAAFGMMAALFALALSSPIRATRQTQAPMFEVASIRPNTTGTTSGGSSPSGQVAFNNQTIRDLISRAYEVPFERVEGGPDWLIRDRFDFIAKAPAETPAPQRTLMLRSFLAERLKLVVRQEPRDMPAFAMVIARADRRLGPQLRPSSVDCDVVRASRGGGAAPPTPPGERPVCGGTTRPGFITAGAVTMAEAADRFLRAAGRPVIDRTGLTGRYDFDIKFTPDEILKRADRSGPIEGPTFAQALQEQLGLRLDPIRAPVTFIVVQSIERPSEN